MLLAALVTADGDVTMAMALTVPPATITEVEQLLYREAELLDAWNIEGGLTIRHHRTSLVTEAGWMGIHPAPWPLCQV